MSADCIHPPCPEPVAIQLTVTSSTGGPVPGLALAFTGAASGGGPCNVDDTASHCSVPGTAGTYNLQLTATGFQPKTFSVVVTGTTPECGCPTVDVQPLNVVLDAASAAMADR